jgi:hypothetical protein
MTTPDATRLPQELRKRPLIPALLLLGLLALGTLTKSIVLFSRAIRAHQPLPLPTDAGGWLRLIGPAVLLLGVGLPLLLAARRWLLPGSSGAALAGRLLGMDEAPTKEAPKATRTELLAWGGAGFAVVLIGLGIVSRMQAYYFTQDDNFVQFLPVLLQGCESLLEQGRLATWNAYQLLGSPTTSIGTYALTYPPTYLCYLWAKHVLHDPYKTIEVFAWVHLIAGYFATFAMLRAVGLRPALAASGSVAFILSGWMLTAGRSWFYMMPTAVWAPLLLLALARLQKGPVGARWTIGLGIVIGAFFHSGNAQMWIYALLLFFAGLAILTLGGIVPWKRAAWTVPALLIGLAIAAPLLIAQNAETKDIDRMADVETGVLKGIPAMALPYPLVKAEHPEEWETRVAKEHENDSANVVGSRIYYFGTVFFLTGLAGGLALLLFALFYKDIRPLLARNVWLLCAFLALWFGLGKMGILAMIMSHLPLFNKLRYIWKFMDYITLFFIIAGGVVTERLLRHQEQSPRGTTGARVGGTGIAVLVIGLMLYNTSISRTAFSFYSDNLPYPALPSHFEAYLMPLENHAPPVRIFRLGPTFSSAPELSKSLFWNTPTIYKIPAVTGYDPIVEDDDLTRVAMSRISKTPRQALRQYGVRWIAVHQEPEYGEDPTLRADLAKSVKLLVDNSKVSLYELPGSEPLAYDTANPTVGFPISIEADGVTVSLPDTPGQAGERKVVVNWLARPLLTAFAPDGRSLTTEKDACSRLVVTVPPDVKTVEVRYQPPWSKGLLIGALLVVIGVIGIRGLGRQEKV